tara:strand:+ start:3380 stop:3931 length:552 start_codon:yes stop_codon:yes gene_type:complete
MAYSHASLERDKKLERYEGKTRDLVSLSNWQNSRTEKLGLLDVSLSFALDPTHSQEDLDKYFDNDENNQFIKHDLLIKSDDDVVVQGVKFLLRTRRHEALFDPDFYCDLESFLFEFVNDISAQGMKKIIEDSIKRSLSDVVTFKGVEIQPRPDENGYRITIFVSQIGKSETIVITDFLQIQGE